MNLGDWVRSKRGGPPMGRVTETGNALITVKLSAGGVVWLAVDDLEVCEPPPAPSIIDVDPDKLGVTRAPVLRGELALLRELHGCIAMREDVLTSEVRDLLEQLENRRVHCYQTSITLRDRPAKGYGETLCGIIVEDWFGTAEQMGLVGPFDALDHPECVTCLECAVLLPALRTQIYEEKK